MNADDMEWVISPILLGGLGVQLFLLSMPSICRLWDRWQSSNGVRCEGRVLAVRSESYVSGDERPTKTRYDFSYSYTAQDVERWGQDTWLERDAAYLWGIPPVVNAAIVVEFDPSNPQRSVTYPLHVASYPEYPPDSARFDAPTGDAGVALLGFFGLSLIWLPFRQPGAATVVGVLLVPTLAVVVARCLHRDRDRSVGILWYTWILGAVEILASDAAYRGHSLGMALSGVLATGAIFAGLGWYLRAVRGDILQMPTLPNGAAVRWLQSGLGRHIWIDWDGAEAEVKIRPRMLRFGSMSLRGMVRVHRALTPAPDDAPRSRAIVAADLGGEDGSSLRRLPRMAELFRRFPEALIVLRWEALYVEISSGLRSATDALAVAQLARDILGELSNAPDGAQGYRDRSSLAETRPDDLRTRILERTPKRWDKL
jgi:hypothetical protein